jgi:hypothetical protein
MEGHLKRVRWPVIYIFYFRTDNDLKNHFYSTLRKSLRRLNKSLGEKNSTSQMREIKPSVLSKIMNHIYDGENKSNLLDSLKGIFLCYLQMSPA